MSTKAFPPRSEGKLVLGPAGGATVGSEVTISSGAITVTGSWHSVDTEGDAASDDLTNINGGVPGQLLLLQAQHGSRTVVCKDGSGNLSLNREFNMASIDDMLLLAKQGNDLWVELARSQNVPLLTEDPANPGFGELWYRIDIGAAGKYKFRRISDTVYLAVEGEAVGTITNKTGAYTASVNDFVRAVGTFTVTLPSAPANDSLVVVKNAGAGTITVARGGTDTIFTTSSVTSFTLAAGASAMLKYYAAGTEWQSF